jgi:putative glutamine amidotransferase
MRTIKLYNWCIWLLVLAFLSACSLPVDQEPGLTIAISKERKTENKYSDWLAHQQIDFAFIDLSQLPINEAMKALEKADGLLLTGGNDIYPGWYGKEYDTARCGVFDHWRDTLELMVLGKALDTKMPVLGICRGLQLINVQQGGTLFIDLPTDKGTGNVHRAGEDGWTEHNVWLQFYDIFPETYSNQLSAVASNHHQGIEQLAPGLKAVAKSQDDDLIEAITLADPNTEQFLLAVQWHPEWMDYKDGFSGELAKKFLLEAAEHKQAREKKLIPR